MVLLALLVPAALLRAQLSAVDRLSPIYDAILAARFDAAQEQLSDACPPAPESACLALRAVAVWWQVQLDPLSRERDVELERASSAALASAAAWTRREPDRAEAWFYLAGSYAPLVQWRILRGERLAAAREGARAKEALERALALDPSLHDAHFGIGLYRYYADVAPRAARMLRWLLLLPGGDRVRGLREMLQVRDRGQLLRGEADYQLHWIYLWYENDPRQALRLVQRLDDAYPSNPIFLERIAEIQAAYLQDRSASLGAWQALLARTLGDGVAVRSLAEMRARLGLASTLLALARPADALDQLSVVVERRPRAPYGALARAHLLAGDAYLRLNRRDRARASFTDAITHAPHNDPERVRAQAKEALRRNF